MAHVVHFHFVCFDVDVLRIRSHGIHHHVSPTISGIFVSFLPTTKQANLGDGTFFLGWDETASLHLNRP